MRVGIREKNKKKYYTYKDVHFDEDGWADVNLYLPMEYDLCYLKTANEETKIGWSKGNKWDGQKIKKTDVILFWKRKSEWDA
jgi:hypothetical protein